MGSAGRYRHCQRGLCRAGLTLQHNRLCTLTVLIVFRLCTTARVAARGQKVCVRWCRIVGVGEGQLKDQRLRRLIRLGRRRETHTQNDQCMNEQ